MIAKGIKTEKKNRQESRGGVYTTPANRAATATAKKQNQDLSLPPIDGHKAKIDSSLNKKLSATHPYRKS